MLTKIAVARKLSVSCNRVWEAIYRIGRLHVWFPGITTCEVDGEGVGAYRYMTLGPRGEMVDRIVEIDHTERRLTYQRVKSPFAVISYKGTVEVFESFDLSAVVVWTVDFESEPRDSTSVAQVLEAGIGAGIDGLERDLLGTAT